MAVFTMIPHATLRHTIQVKGLKFVKKSGIILPQSLFCELSEADKKTEGAEATRFEN